MNMAMMTMGDKWATMGSSLAGLFVFCATLQRIFPRQLTITIREFFLSAIRQIPFVQKCSDKIINMFSPYVQITFPEYVDHRFNHAYGAIKSYLGPKAIDDAKHLKASQVRETKSLVLKRGEKKTEDEFEGAKLYWEMNSTANQEKYYRLTFHRCKRDIVTGSYLNYVMEEGKSTEDKNKKIRLFMNNPNSYWKTSRKNLWSSIDFEHPATFETLAMDPKKKEEILNDLIAFKDGKEYYNKVGKAWKRGYLLYGPPGTGKSTMIAAMANLLNYNIYDLEITAIESNWELRKLLIATTNKSIILIEDIDCSLDLTGDRNKKYKARDGCNSGDNKSEEEEKNKKRSSVTLSGLLNFIDGIWSACGRERIIVFTTNHLEKLDPALIRRGRMDMHIELSYCNFEAFKVLAKNYLGLDSHCLFEDIEYLLKETKITPADIAESLMAKNHEKDRDGSLRYLIQVLKETKKNQRIERDEEE